MTDDRFIIDGGVLVKYIGSDGQVVLPNGITAVGDRAFYGCDRVAEVIIPHGITAIGAQAFMNCAYLTEIILPDTLLHIGHSAFLGCDSLERIELPNSLRILPTSCFYECAELKSVRLPHSLQKLSPRTFYGCSALEAIELPFGLTEIERSAFEYCSALKSVSLPNSLVHIGKHAFARCRALADIAVPKSVERIGSSAFYQTPFLERALLTGGGFAVVGDGILIGCSADPEDIAVPDGVKRIGELAFGYNERLRSVSLLEGVTEICEGAFESCTALTEVTLPDSLRIIGCRAFEDCTALESISLPSGIERIGKGAFERTPAAYSADGLILNGRYLISHVGGEDIPQIPDCIEVIAGAAFSGDTDIRSAVLGGRVRSVCGEAFRFCKELTEVRISAGVGYIGEYAFSGCDMLHAYIERAHRAVDEGAFEQGQCITFIDGQRSFTVYLQSELAEHSCESALFDFAAEPSGKRFERLRIPEYLLPAAVCYAEDGGVYAEYLRENIAAAVCMAVDRADSGMLRQALAYGFLTERQAAECAAYAIEKKALEQQVMIMRCKQQQFGSADGESLDSRFDW